LRDKVVPRDTYPPSHQDCWNVFLLVSEKHMYILSAQQKPKETFWYPSTLLWRT
jgi:hypothetical protein